MEEEWKKRLPVVYVPVWQVNDLVDVYVEDEEVGGYYVIYLWFRWRIDWPIPPYNKPEYEPLAIAYKPYKSAAEMVFHRPHTLLVSRRPTRNIDGKPVVFVDIFGGHAFWVHPLTVFMATALQTVSALLTYPLRPVANVSLYRRIDVSEIASYGAPKDIEEWDRWTGESFKECVRASLTRPQKNIRRGLQVSFRRMLKTVLHLLRASSSVRRLDVKKTYTNLVKAYLSLPRFARCTEVGYTLVEHIVEFRYATTSNTPIPPDVARKRMLAFLMGIPLTLLSPLLYLERVEPTADWKLLELLRNARTKQPP